MRRGLEAAGGQKERLRGQLGPNLSGLNQGHQNSVGHVERCVGQISAFLLHQCVFDNIILY